MIERLAAAARRVERDPELLLDALLPDELGERARAERAARAPPRRRRRQRGARNGSFMPLSSAPSAPAPRPAATRRRPRARARRRRGTSRARRGRRARAARRQPPHRRRRARASLSFSSITTRCAVLRPMPGIASKRARSSRAIARRSSAGGEPETIASATFGPDPGDAEQQLEQVALVGRGEAVELQRVLADMEVGLDRDLLADARRAPAASPRRGSRPRRRRSAARPRPRRERPRRRAISVSRQVIAQGTAGGGRLYPAIRRSGGASAWQIATASASAAWSGRGSLVEREDRLHHPLHLPLVGAAVAADRLLDPARRVLDALDARGRRGDEDGAARLPDGERDAGVGADVRLLQGDGIRRVLPRSAPRPPRRS